MIINKYKVCEYLTKSGTNPFREWLDSFPFEVKARIQARIFRVEDGNFGDFKSIGHGVCELRVAFGPGYRVYYGLDGKDLVILICGGDKSSQRKDIIKAKLYWLDYLERTRNDKT